MLLHLPYRDFNRGSYEPFFKKTRYEEHTQVLLIESIESVEPVFKKGRYDLYRETPVTLENIVNDVPSEIQMYKKPRLNDYKSVISLVSNVESDGTDDSDGGSITKKLRTSVKNLGEALFDDDVNQVGYMDCESSEEMQFGYDYIWL